MNPLKAIREDRGSALIPVLGYTIVLSLLMSVTAVAGQRMVRTARHSQDFHAAVQAAYAGAADYIARMNADSTYVKWANTPSSGCTGTAASAAVDPANKYMSATSQPLTGGASGSTVRYTVDETQLCDQGTIKLTAVGTSQGVDRTVNFLIRHRSFLDYAYFSDYESLDPARYTTNPFAAQGDTVDHVCRRHYYESSASDPTKAKPVWPAPRDSKCSGINWIDGDRVTGAMHSNDALLICGKPSFQGRTTSSYRPTSGPRYLPNGGSCINNPSFAGNYNLQVCGTANDICYDDPLQMPPANTALKSVPGACIYSGPTRIVLLTGKRYKVTSPNTPMTASCGGGSSAVTVNYPSSGVVYTQNATSGVACTTPAGNLSPRNPVGYPWTGDVTTYGCLDGDVFIEGWNDGRITVGAENRIVVTNDIFAPGSAGSPQVAAGFIANKSIEIYHPVDSAGTNIKPDSPVNTIYGALLTVNGSVLVQNYDKGDPLGPFVIIGGLSQRWRGLFGTTDGMHGYKKDFQYDNRILYGAPPYFLEPVQTAWRVVESTQG